MAKNLLLHKRAATRDDLGLTPAEFAVLRRLNTPEKIQAYVNAIPHNWELGGETCLSVRTVLHEKRALCIEGAMLAAAALWVNGEPPLIMDLRATRDYDHIVTLFRRNGCWGGNLQDQRSLSALARPGLPQLAGTSDELFSRIRQPARAKNLA